MQKAVNDLPSDARHTDSRNCWSGSVSPATSQRWCPLVWSAAAGNRKSNDLKMRFVLFLLFSVLRMSKTKSVKELDIASLPPPQSPSMQRASETMQRNGTPFKLMVSVTRVRPLQRLQFCRKQILLDKKTLFTTHQSRAIRTDRLTRSQLRQCTNIGDRSQQNLQRRDQSIKSSKLELIN